MVKQHPLSMCSNLYVNYQNVRIAYAKFISVTIALIGLNSPTGITIPVLYIWLEYISSLFYQIGWYTYRTEYSFHQTTSIQQQGSLYDWISKLSLQKRCHWKFGVSPSILHYVWWVIHDRFWLFTHFLFLKNYHLQFQGRKMIRRTMFGLVLDPCTILDPDYDLFKLLRTWKITKKNKN